MKPVYWMADGGKPMMAYVREDIMALAVGSLCPFCDPNGLMQPSVTVEAIDWSGQKMQCSRRRHATPTHSMSIGGSGVLIVDAGGRVLANAKGVELTEDEVAP